MTTKRWLQILCLILTGKYTKRYWLSLLLLNIILLQNAFQIATDASTTIDQMDSSGVSSKSIVDDHKSGLYGLELLPMRVPTLSSGTATGCLSSIMDRFHKTVDVYTDADAAGNHFAARGRMPAGATDLNVPPMDEQYCVNPHEGGVTCIKATINLTMIDWGGWYFNNGVLKGSATAPSCNWGNEPNAGINLTGATKC